VAVFVTVLIPCSYGVFGVSSEIVGRYVRCKLWDLWLSLDSRIAHLYSLSEVLFSPLFCNQIYAVEP